MSDRCEQKLIEWCNKTQTNDFDYLDLHKQEPSLSKVACNIELIYDKICLLSKVTLKHFTQLAEENRKLREEVKQLRSTTLNLEKQIYGLKPLGKREIIEIVRQPREVDVEALQLTRGLETEVKKIQKTVLEVKRLIGG